MPLSESKDPSKSKKILVLGEGRFQTTQHGLEASSQKKFAEWFGTCSPLTLEFFLSGLYQNGKSPCMIWPFFYVSLKIKYVLPLKSEHRSYASYNLPVTKQWDVCCQWPKMSHHKPWCFQVLACWVRLPPTTASFTPIWSLLDEPEPTGAPCGKDSACIRNTFSSGMVPGWSVKPKSKGQRFQIFNVCSFAHLVPQVTGEKYMRERGGVEESCSLVGMLWRCCLQHLAAGVLLAAPNSNMHVLDFRVGSFEGPKKPLNSSQLPGPPNYCKMVELMQGLKSDADQK